MVEFAGRGALVTGGASGIGLALARAFVERGMRVVLCDRDAGTLTAAAAELTAAGAPVLALELDVTDRAALRVAMERVRGFTALNIVCANAGIAPAGASLSTMRPEAWDRIVAINLTGVFNTVQATAPLLREHGEGGHFVLTASMAGMLAPSAIGDYAVTKFGVGALGEALRMELAPERIGVSVLYPGVVATPLVGDSQAVGMAPEAVAGRVIRAIVNNELFVFTHGDYRPLVASRFDTVLAAFGPSAQAGFAESEGVLAMMRGAAYPSA